MRDIDVIERRAPISDARVAGGAGCLTGRIPSTELIDKLLGERTAVSRTGVEQHTPVPAARRQLSRCSRAAADVPGSQSSSHRLGETTNADQLQQSDQQHWPRHACENDEFRASSMWPGALREQAGGPRGPGPTHERPKKIVLPKQRTCRYGLLNV